MRVQATTNTCVLLVCIVWKVDCLSSAWKLAVLSPWEELYVILMNRGMGHISSLPAVMQLFRVGCRAQPGSPVDPCCFTAAL